MDSPNIRVFLVRYGRAGVTTGQRCYVPGAGFYFASEYIEYPNCSPRSFFKTDPTCGGTRDDFANFGTSVNFLK